MGEFLFDQFAEREPYHVDSLIWKIIVTVDTTNGYEYDEDPFEDEDESDPEEDPNIEGKTPAVRGLSPLRGLTNVDWIRIKIYGKGSVDGGDAKAREKIKEVAPMVKKLLDQFKYRLQIHRELKTPRSQLPCSTDITSYWNVPSAEAKSKVRQCEATFTERMQVQITDWLEEASPTSG